MTDVLEVNEGRRLPAGTVTFVFTDIEGSTKLFHELGDTYIAVLDDHHKIMRAAITAHDGVEIKTEGDAFFCAWDDPTKAVLAMRDAQLELAKHQFAHGRPVRVRMGIHVGPVAIVDDDYVGISVHEAARIAGAAHGGQILLSEEMVAAIELPSELGTHDLGKHALKDFPEPKRLYQLTGPGLDATFAAPRTLTARGHNLPASPTKLVGRDEEQLKVQALLLGESRLVTLTAAGGFGKSRLAIEIGWSMLSWFREGVWFVALAAVTEDVDIVPTINRALGIADVAGREQIDLLIERLNAGPTLLLLDNLEQLGDGVVFIADLLAACPDLRVLATSRERLRLRGENEVALDGLSSQAAIDLFVQRAEANNPCVDLALADEQTAIAELARYFDGIPLALELAAALVRDQAPSALVPQLDQTLELLTEGERDLPARQRTLRSTIAWSHDLLDEADRRLFDLLAVFAGGVPLPALSAVAASTGLDVDVAASADRLVEKALVRRAEVRGLDDPPRWWLLETIRQFASERLDARPEDGTTGRATHATWFTGWVAGFSRDQAVDQGERFDRLTRDIDNLRLALRGGAPEQRVQLAVGLAPFWDVRGHWREGARWLDEVASIDVPTELRVEALIARATFDKNLVEVASAEARLREAWTIAGELGDLKLQARCAAALADVVLFLATIEGERDDLAIDQIERPQERLDEARGLLDEAAENAAKAGDIDAEANTRSVLASLLLNIGDYPAARQAAITAVELFRRIGDRHNVALSFHTVATADLHGGDPTMAVEHAIAGIAEAQAIGDKTVEGELLWIEALARGSLGQLEQAYAKAEAAYEVLTEAGDDANAASVLFVRGLLSQQAGDIEGARHWMTRSADAWRAFGDDKRARWCEEAVADLEATA